jgi:hypothetical protein
VYTLLAIASVAASTTAAASHRRYFGRYIALIIKPSPLRRQIALETETETRNSI